MDEPFSWKFLEDIAKWSVALAVVAMVAGYALTGSPRFVAGLLLGAVVDIATLEGIAREGKRQLDKGYGAMVGGVASLMALRLVVKAGVLVAAVLAPALLDMWGALVGVLVVDTTLVTVGSAKAVARVFG